jgi:hypothetical protein
MYNNLYFLHKLRVNPKNIELRFREICVELKRKPCAIIRYLLRSLHDIDSIIIPLGRGFRPNFYIDLIEPNKRTELI